MSGSGRFEVSTFELRDGIKALGLFDRENPKQKPVVVDFDQPTLRHRVRNGADGEMVVKAMGLKKSERAGVLVYDFTMGLGTDSFLLANAGFRVFGFERDPELFRLLEDGLRRWSQAESFSLAAYPGDATSVSLGDEKPHAILLDPMFEDDALEGKSLPKKEMASLRAWLKPSSREDLEALFKRAMSLAMGRVVVKRPAGAPLLVTSPRPSHQLEGKSARFDIYSCR